MCGSKVQLRFECFGIESNKRAWGGGEKEGKYRMKNAVERRKEKVVNEHRSILITIYSTLVKRYISLLWCLIYRGKLFAVPSETVWFWFSDSADTIGSSALDFCQMQPREFHQFIPAHCSITSCWTGAHLLGRHLFLAGSRGELFQLFISLAVTKFALYFPFEFANLCSTSHRFVPWWQLIYQFSIRQFICANTVIGKGTILSLEKLSFRGGKNPNL